MLLEALAINFMGYLYWCEGNVIMYDTTLTGMSLPEKEYCYLLGVALSVFSSNNGFIIENIIRTDNSYSWNELIDKESGKLKIDVANTIAEVAGPEILDTYSNIVEKRNRIIHGFRITSNTGEQILATKVKNSGEQFYITEDYLKDFIQLNSELSKMLHQYRRICKNLIH